MLYIIGTPIGNLDDLSLRQARTLASSDIILAEDTRSAGILLKAVSERFGLDAGNGRIISYFKDTEFQKLPQAIASLEEGKQVSLISESGMPLISDPGQLLIKECIKRNLPFTVIPGPTAFATAFAFTGYNIDWEKGGLYFIGFLPKSPGKLLHSIDVMKKLKSVHRDISIVCYESPLRIGNTLIALAKSYPGAEITVARELTKKFEEVVRGSPADIAGRPYKGEIVLIIK